jgi:hypothetical protein
MVPILASSNVNWRRLLGCVGREVLLSDVPFLRSRAMFAPGTNLRCLDSGLENGPVAAVVGGVETELVCSDALPVTTALVGGIFRGIEDMLPSVLVIDEPTTLACWPRIFTSFIVPAVAEHLARSELRLTADCEGADCCSPSDAVRCEFQVEKAGVVVIGDCVWTSNCSCLEVVDAPFALPKSLLRRLLLSCLVGRGFALESFLELAWIECGGSNA